MESSVSPVDRRSSCRLSVMSDPSPSHEGEDPLEAEPDDIDADCRLSVMSEPSPETHDETVAEEPIPARYIHSSARWLQEQHSGSLTTRSLMIGVGLRPYRS